MASELQHMSEEDLLLWLSHRPKFLADAFVSVPISIQHTAFDRSSSVLSDSLFGPIPGKILPEIVGHLDIQSVLRFASVSTRARGVVEALPSYKHLVEHAPGVLAALVQTNTAHFHSIKTLHDTLQVAECASCGLYGTYLFLLTCQRCCYECLDRKPFFWLKTKSAARQAFSLALEQLQQASETHSLAKYHGPDHFMVMDGKWCGVDYGTWNTDHMYIASLEAILQIGLSVHGSKQALEDALPPEPLREINSVYAGPLILLWRLLNSDFNSTPVPVDQLPEVFAAKGADNPFAGMGVTFAPVLDNDRVKDTGLWCLGCKKTVAQEDAMRAAGHVESTLTVRHDTRAWSRDGFLQHVKTCRGARAILEEARVQGISSKDLIPGQLFLQDSGKIEVVPR